MKLSLCLLFTITINFLQVNCYISVIPYTEEFNSSQSDPSNGHSGQHGKTPSSDEFMAVIYTKDCDHICGGVFLQSNIVLTTSDCLRSCNDSEIRVYPNNPNHLPNCDMHNNDYPVIKRLFVLKDESSEKLSITTEYPIPPSIITLPEETTKPSKPITPSYNHESRKKRELIEPSESTDEDDEHEEKIHLSEDADDIIPPHPPHPTIHPTDHQMPMRKKTYYTSEPTEPTEETKGTTEQYKPKERNHLVLLMLFDHPKVRPIPIWRGSNTGKENVVVRNLGTSTSCQFTWGSDCGFRFPRTEDLCGRIKPPTNHSSGASSSGHKMKHYQGLPLIVEKNKKPQLLGLSYESMGDEVDFFAMRNYLKNIKESMTKLSSDRLDSDIPYDMRSSDIETHGESFEPIPLNLELPFAKQINIVHGDVNIGNNRCVCKISNTRINFALDPETVETLEYEVSQSDGSIHDENHPKDTVISVNNNAQNQNVVGKPKSHFDGQQN